MAHSVLYGLHQFVYNPSSPGGFTPMLFNLRPFMISALLLAWMSWGLAACGNAALPSSTEPGPNGSEVPNTSSTDDAEDTVNEDSSNAEDADELTDDSPGTPDESESNPDDISSDPVEDNTENNDDADEEPGTDAPDGNPTIPNFSFFPRHSSSRSPYISTTSS